MRCYARSLLLPFICAAFGATAQDGGSTKLPAYWENPNLPAAEFAQMPEESGLVGITVNGNVEAPLKDYKKLLEAGPVIEFYNMATNRMMVFTSMQSFVQFAEEADLAMVEQMVEDEYQKVMQAKQSGKGKLSTAKDLTAGGWDTDESIWVMNFPYRQGCLRHLIDLFTYSTECDYGASVYGRDRDFNPMWWRQAPSGDDDDSFVLTATPLNSEQREEAEDEHVYVSSVQVSQVCEVINFFGCNEYWSDQTVKSIVMGQFADVTLIADGQPARFSREGLPYNPGGAPIQVSLEAPPGQIFIKNPMFWQFCSMLPNCRDRFFTIGLGVIPADGIPPVWDYRPQARGMSFYPWQFFRLIPRADQVIIAAGSRAPVISRVKVSSYGRNSDNARPGENVIVGGYSTSTSRITGYSRAARVIAALSEAASGCDTAIVRHRLPAISNEFWCPVPTQIERGLASPFASVPMTNGRRASIFYYFTPGLSTSDTPLGTTSEENINFDCSPDGIVRYPLNEFLCRSFLANPREQACRLVPLVYATGSMPRPSDYMVDSRFSLAFTASRQLIIPPQTVVIGATPVDPSISSGAGFDRCVGLYRAYVPGGPRSSL